MANILVLGAGKFGSAITIPLTDNGHAVHLIGTHLDESIIDTLRNNNPHPGIGYPLPEAVQYYTYDQLDSLINDADLLILAVTALGIDWVGMMLAMLDNGLPPNLPILFLTKGLEGKTDGNYWFSKNERLSTLPNALNEALMDPMADARTMLIAGGPATSEELFHRQPSRLVVASTDLHACESVAELLSTPALHIQTTADVVGVQIFGALKDVYALAAGIAAATSAATSDKANETALIIAQGVSEATYLVEFMGGNAETADSLAGKDDFQAAVADATHQKLARYLAQGQRYADVKLQHMQNEPVDGAEVTLSIGRTIEFLCIDGDLKAARLPLLRTMIDVICNDGVAEIPWAQFR